MHDKISLRARAERELEMAHQARQARNEGKARVCARRAAGIAIGAWLSRERSSTNVVSAIERLRVVADDARQPDSIRAAAHHLTLRINVDHGLPVAADPLVDARQLLTYFLDDSRKDADNV